MANDRRESHPLEAFTSNIDFKMNLLNDVMADYRKIKQAISGVMEEKESLQREKERLQQEKERLQHKHLENEDVLARMNEEILSTKKTLAEARDAIVSSTELISQKDEYVEFLEKKLQESESKNNQAEQQGGAKTIEPGGVQTSSLQKRKRASEGPLDYDSDTIEPTSQLDDQSLPPSESLENPNVQIGSMKMKRRLSERTTLGNDNGDNLEAIEEGPRQEVANNPTVGQTSGVQSCDEDGLVAITGELVKGFHEIDYCRRKIGIKGMGLLSEKAFKTACHAKVPPEEVGTAFDQLYSSWKQQLGDLSWYPFKRVTIDGNYQEIVNLDDDKLQELKRVWGQDAHNAVVTALVEMKEYDRLSDRSTANELWNYKEGRKATRKECVQYLFNQVKLLSASKRGKLSGPVVGHETAFQLSKIWRGTGSHKLLWIKQVVVLLHGSSASDVVSSHLWTGGESEFML